MPDSVEVNDPPPALRRYTIAHDRSAVLFAARSNVGLVSFGTTEVVGTIDVLVEGDAVDLTVPPSARLEVSMGSLTSGNSLYDVELHRRVDVRRFPTTVVELAKVEPGPGVSYRVNGPITFHGVTRELAGTVSLSFPRPGTIAIAGEHALDIRDFGIAVPSMLMLKIFPDGRVQLQVEADLAG